ncbi:MAG: hypothetical protein Q7K21_07425 [Elusimicrobiota bacterium]|nr:hypothetical protein [Elusimicrobiota bacterium]
MNKKLIFNPAVGIFLIFNCCYIYSQEIKISDTDIALMKLEKNIIDIQNSIAGMKETSKLSGDTSSILTEKITKLEEETAMLKKSLEEISVLRRQIAELEKSQKDMEAELKKNFGNKIKANEDAIEIILSDIYRLREDIVAGRKPTVSVKKPFKEYIPYIALGVSVISLIVAVH